MNKLSLKINMPILLLFTIIIGGCGQNQDMKRTQTLDTLDLNRYLGTWYEIARFDHSFERGLQGVTATYSMRSDGKIKVVNQGYKGSLDGPLKTAVGKAKIPDPTKPAQLKVSFFWIFYGDYFVLELDEENYQWAIIGSSSEKYLWILSRKPQLEKTLIDDLLLKIKARGYQTEDLIWVPQKES